MVKTDPSVVLQEYCFNQLVRRVAERCTFVDGYQSSAMILPDTHVYAIRHLKHLTRIDLKYSQDLNDNVFHALAETVHSLSYLRLPGSEMEDVSAQAVADMIMSLQKNTLQQFKIIYGTNIFKDNSVLKAIGQRHGGSMQRLTLAICDLENAGLQEYGPLCTKLVSLNLEYSSGVTDDVVLPILDGCPQLEKLDLTETDCTHATIHGLSTASDSTKPHSGRFAAMKRLVLNNIDSPFTTNLFLPLADACPMLEELHMNSILADSFQDFALFISKTKHLRDLDIGNAFPEFTDDNLISLVDALPNLRWLSIANAQITNASVVYLGEKAHSLCDLCILGCDQVTKTGLIEFLDKMSNKAGFKHLDITYCRLDDGAVVEIRERAKAMAIGHGLVEVVEVEGDDQFSDSLLEEDGERDDGEEADDDDDETEEDSDGEDRDSATELEEEDDDEY
ncbi:hypothetical protein BC939DRAFT_433830 [Gamsiella multidivaricata]|uniref:uncharacterized protein n=1 Tax=Gamsiella multidivaricata TaxID=101098 RepID=UPI00221FDC9F|nr:uncharacterized protein BC939DRAFT_433830 [Gamsiella multidivaricata]KAI7832603.1 hypothetical protein BC939DRAFT_433830 [Gamsiella multidivaricata]